MSEPSERNPEIIERVREKLEKYPELKSRQLYDMAVRLDTSLATLGLRSFHARYVLPIMRERARAEGRIKPRAPRKKRVAAKTAAATAAGASDQKAARTRSSRGPSSDEHARVRAILLRFARDVAAAESRADIVDLIGGIDAVAAAILER